MSWPTVTFEHEFIGSLAIDNGIDSAQWAYNLNTATFPTFGGEVVQILSVYIDNLTIGGTVATYRQMQEIYSYFSRYLQVATQGTNQNKAHKSIDNTGGGAFNLKPIYFHYGERKWNFKIFPLDVPGFHIGTDVVGPTWEVTCFVLDEDTQEMALIKNGISALVTTGVIAQKEGQSLATAGSASLDINSFNLTGNISPDSANPNTDPFQTFDAGTSGGDKDVRQLASYFNSLIPSYYAHDFSSLTGIFGSKPNFGETKNQTNKDNKNGKSTKQENPPKKGRKNG